MSELRMNGPFSEIDPQQETAKQNLERSSQVTTEAQEIEWPNEIIVREAEISVVPIPDDPKLQGNHFSKSQTKIYQVENALPEPVLVTFFQQNGNIATEEQLASYLKTDGAYVKPTVRLTRLANKEGVHPADRVRYKGEIIQN